MAAAARSVSGVEDRYWNLPVSVTIPAYRQAAAESGSGVPISSISRNTTSADEEAAGSMALIVPKPGFVT